jgi:hypothetical protein
MSDRAVQIVSSYNDATKVLLEKIPVAFIVYDPEASASGDSSSIDASGATDAEKESEKIIQSTERTRVFGQVARKMQAQGSFGLLLSDVSPEEVAKFFDEENAVPMGGFIARIEQDVPTKIYDGELTSDSFIDFVRDSNLPIVIELGGHNFRLAGRKGKPMAIGVYDPDDEIKTKKFRQELKQYATRGVHKDDYVFSTMDGKKWNKFLSQFSITKEGLPELFVLDVPARTYWQDSSVFGVSDFIKSVKNGEIESREQEARMKNPFEEFLDNFVKYMPWSLLAVLGVLGGTFYIFLPKSYADNTRIRPSPPSKKSVKAETGEDDVSNKKDK